MKTKNALLLVTMLATVVMGAGKCGDADVNPAEARTFKTLAKEAAAVVTEAAEPVVRLAQENPMYATGAGLATAWGAAKAAPYAYAAGKAVIGAAGSVAAAASSPYVLAGAGVVAGGELLHDGIVAAANNLPSADTVRAAIEPAVHFAGENPAYAASAGLLASFGMANALTGIASGVVATVGYPAAIGTVAVAGARLAYDNWDGIAAASRQLASVVVQQDPQSAALVAGLGVGGLAVAVGAAKAIASPYILAPAALIAGGQLAYDNWDGITAASKYVADAGMSAGQFVYDNRYNAAAAVVGVAGMATMALNSPGRVGARADTLSETVDEAAGEAAWNRGNMMRQTGKWMVIAAATAAVAKVAYDNREAIASGAIHYANKVADGANYAWNTVSTKTVDFGTKAKELYGSVMSELVEPSVAYVKNLAGEGTQFVYDNTYPIAAVGVLAGALKVAYDVIDVLRDFTGVVGGGRADGGLVGPSMVIMATAAAVTKAAYENREGIVDAGSYLKATAHESGSTLLESVGKVPGYLSNVYNSVVNTVSGWLAPNDVFAEVTLPH